MIDRHKLIKRHNVKLEEPVYDSPLSVGNGEFVFTITAEDTKTLGLGQHPIQIDIIDAASGILMHSLTEGAENGEFSKINIVQV